MADDVFLPEYIVGALGWHGGVNVCTIQLFLIYRFNHFINIKVWNFENLGAKCPPVNFLYLLRGKGEINICFIDWNSTSKNCYTCLIYFSLWGFWKECKHSFEKWIFLTWNMPWNMKYGNHVDSLNSYSLAIAGSINLKSLAY